MRQTGLTQGNLSSHLNKLEAGGYVEVQKEFEGKRPHTMLKLTPEGRIALEEYATHMQLMIEPIDSQRPKKRSKQKCRSTRRSLASA
jgi:DNA-binding MarR family transcriptional regulator